jgi:hypothetical protein
MWHCISFQTWPVISQVDGVHYRVQCGPSQRQHRLVMVQLLAELPSTCRALALGGDTVEALAALGNKFSLGQHSSEVGGASLHRLINGM